MGIRTRLVYASVTSAATACPQELHLAEAAWVPTRCQTRRATLNRGTRSCNLIKSLSLCFSVATVQGFARFIWSCVRSVKHRHTNWSQVNQLITHFDFEGSGAFQSQTNSPKWLLPSKAFRFFVLPDNFNNFEKGKRVCALLLRSVRWCLLRGESSSITPRSYRRGWEFCPSIVPQQSLPHIESINTRR